MTAKASPTADTKDLIQAIEVVNQQLGQHVSDLLEADDGSEEAMRKREAIRTAQTLLECLCALTKGRTMRSIHDAFGAPGDFGYQTPIGQDLRKIYGC